jgi:hypothetical protein
VSTYSVNTRTGAVASRSSEDVEEAVALAVAVAKRSKVFENPLDLGQLGPRHLRVLRQRSRHPALVLRQVVLVERLRHVGLREVQVRDAPSRDAGETFPPALQASAKRERRAGGPPPVDGHHEALARFLGSSSATLLTELS